jgi:hypothetical protein
MPKPIPGGKVEGNIDDQLIALDRQDVKDFVKIGFLAAKGDVEGIMALAEQGTERNLVAIEVGVYKQVGLLRKAEDTLMNWMASARATAAAIQRRLAG